MRSLLRKRILSGRTVPAGIADVDAEVDEIMADINEMAQDYEVGAAVASVSTFI